MTEKLKCNLKITALVFTKIIMILTGHLLILYTKVICLSPNSLCSYLLIRRAFTRFARIVKST